MIDVNIQITVETWHEYVGMLREIHADVAALKAAAQKEMLTIKEACELIGVSRWTIKRYLDDNILTKHTKDNGRNIYLSRKEIEEKIKDGRI